MTHERWERLKDVFQGAIDQPVSERPGWLTRACAGDTTLLREAEALLASHDTAGEFLEEPARVASGFRGADHNPADIDVLALDEALERLAAIDPEQARIVELRYFGGLTVEETAEVMGSSPATVKRHWAMARAWLKQALEGAPPDRS